MTGQEKQGETTQRQVGAWLLDLHSGAAWRDDAHDQAFGYTHAEGEWTMDRFMDHVVPADHRIILDRYVAAVDRGQPWSFACDVKGGDGKVRRIKASGDFLPGDRYGPPRLTGFVMGIRTIEEMAEALRMRIAQLRSVDTALCTQIMASERAAQRQPDEAREAVLRRLDRTARQALAAFGATD